MQQDYKNDDGTLTYGETPEDERARRERQALVDAAPPQSDHTTNQGGGSSDEFDSSRVPKGIDQDWARDFIKRNPGDYSRIASAYGSNNTSSKSASVAQSWVPPSGGAGGGGGGVTFPDWYRELMLKQQSIADQAQAENKARADSLFDRLHQRASQSLTIQRPTADQTGPDPNAHIWAQIDNNAAVGERARRNYLSDVAEGTGPYANLRGEQRLSAEKLGQNNAGFQADLVGREIGTRRAEIADALHSEAGLLSGDQQRELAREMGLMDQAMKEGSLGLQSQLGNRGLDIDWMRALMGNDQFMRNMDFNYWDRDNFYQRY